MPTTRRNFLTAAGVLVASVGLNKFAGSDSQLAAVANDNTYPSSPEWFVPKPPKFPNFTNRNTLIAETKQISDKLEAYVKAWLDGKADAKIPQNLLPKGTDTKELKNFRLVRPEEVKAEEQWGIRPAEEIDLSKVPGYFPDPHCTYIVLPNLFAPFGSKVIVEGQFPHSRFFDIQATPSFHPEAYRYVGFGAPEVPILDADIEPLPGHTNPFRVGANRNATKRGYRVTFELAQGNPVELNRAYRPPFWRDGGNTRTASAIQYQGPWGLGQGGGHGRGPWTVGEIWIRYYAPDKQQGALAGVPLPKVYYQLSDGRKFFIVAEFAAWLSRSNKRIVAKKTSPEEPLAKLLSGPNDGWVKKFGILRAILIGTVLETKWANQKYIRELDQGVAGRGEDLPPPGNYEQAATECNYINYLVRGMSLGAGKVAVLTGKLPTFPQTRNGEAQMTGAQMRYWSLTATSPDLPELDGFVGAVLHSVMDDDIVLDNQRHYVIVLSRDSDRPSNANSQNGVTWVNWGPHAKVTWTLRWLSVGSEWSFAYTPTTDKLGWASDWASTRYDRSLVGNNNQAGFLKAYQPVVHYLSKSDFEKLGKVDPLKIPVWR